MSGMGSHPGSHSGGSPIVDYYNFFGVISNPFFFGPTKVLQNDRNFKRILNFEFLIPMSAYKSSKSRSGEFMFYRREIDFREG
jgi:hypothetical protein